jgi:hypothetical protein
MDVLLHFVRPGKAGRVDRKDAGTVEETERTYRSVGEYDAVLKSHCGLDGERSGAESHGDGSHRQL